MRFLQFKIFIHFIFGGYITVFRAVKMDYLIFNGLALTGHGLYHVGLKNHV
jgi:hypothetical protein